MLEIVHFTAQLRTTVREESTGTAKAIASLPPGGGRADGHARVKDELWGGGRAPSVRPPCCMGAPPHAAGRPAAGLLPARRQTCQPPEEQEPADDYHPDRNVSSFHHRTASP